MFITGHVNITGIKTFEEVKDATIRFTQLTGKEVNQDNIKVNNSTASGNLLSNSSNKFLSLKKVKNIIEKNQEELNGTFNFRPHHFPGAVFRRNGKLTIIIFPSGRYIIVGGKNKLQIREAHRTICRITKKIT